MSAVVVRRGPGPVVIGLPHAGTVVPEEVRAALNERGRALADTDWHVDRLHDGLLEGATTVAATHHRYVVDVNRPPGGESLYPGRNTTSLVPTTDFEGREIWARPPDAAEIARRVAEVHAPYHAALAGEVERVRAAHGHAILYDAHSIRSRLPFLFEGRLPDLNIGTDGGRTAAPELEAAVAAIAAESGFSHVVNGRFRGGWTTRHYGRPATGVHTIQMEIAQETYMEEAPPWPWRADRAAGLRPVLARILETLAAWRPS